MQKKCHLIKKGLIILPRQYGRSRIRQIPTLLSLACWPMWCVHDYRKYNKQSEEHLCHTWRIMHTLRFHTSKAATIIYAKELFTYLSSSTWCSKSLKPCCIFHYVYSTYFSLLHGQIKIKHIKKVKENGYNINLHTRFTFLTAEGDISAAIWF